MLLYLLLASAGGVHGIGSRRWIVVAAAAGAALTPPAAGVGLRGAGGDPPANASRPGAGAVVVGLLAAAYFVFTAVHQGRDLFPKTHDDQSYLLQMRMLAGGRLWMPQHELADFFDTFYVLVRPKYASFYFPGAALLYVPTIWLGLPTWLMPAAVAGAVVGLVYRLTCELLDGAAALLAAVVLTSLSWFRVYSVLLTSHEPMLLLGLLMMWAWLRYRRGRRPGWLLAVGAFAGWGAVTRPVDALCFAVPIGVALLLDLTRQPRGDGRNSEPAIPAAPAAPATRETPAPSRPPRRAAPSAPLGAVRRLFGPAAGRRVRFAATAFLLTAGAAVPGAATVRQSRHQRPVAPHALHALPGAGPAQHLVRLSALRPQRQAAVARAAEAGLLPILRRALHQESPTGKLPGNVGAPLLPHDR